MKAAIYCRLSEEDRNKQKKQTDTEKEQSLQEIESQDEMSDEACLALADKIEEGFFPEEAVRRYETKNGIKWRERLKKAEAGQISHLKKLKIFTKNLKVSNH